MADAAYFREKAQQCRQLLKVVVVPEVVEQLQIWVREYESRAAEIEQHRRTSLTTADLP